MTHLQIEESRLDLAHDGRGFVRRGCPVCARHFKVRGQGGEERIVQRVFVTSLAHANVDELPQLPKRFCPYCGHTATADAFLTSAQRSYIEACARSMAGEVRYEQLKQVERHLDANPYITFVAVAPSDPPPDPPAEPDDMQQAPLLCCGEELKIKSSWRQTFFCHHCRARQGQASP
jgi:hypothetical protein